MHAAQLFLRVQNEWVDGLVGDGLKRVHTSAPVQKKSKDLLESLF